MLAVFCFFCQRIKKKNSLLVHFIFSALNEHSDIFPRDQMILIAVVLFYGIHLVSLYNFILFVAKSY